MTAELPPPDRRIIAEFSTDAAGRTRGRLIVNLAGLAVLTVILLSVFGWAVVREPEASLRALAAASIAGPFVFGALAVLFARRASARRPPNLVRLSDWGVEFDAPPTTPGLAPEESGGAIAWPHVGRVEIQEAARARRRAGLSQVTFYSREFHRRPIAFTVPRFWPWGIRIPYLRREDAEKIIELAEGWIASSTTD
ncbi:MAG TPA: hypothetical protein VGS23_06075 [Thermoplasmata archaeon]|nr:hypothetical protein [Thermoplasmata archaeon]HEV2316686.1 hypothetical protein [Thermoplasmata archaeon]